MSALLAFESAARHGNFSRAAKELDVSQPAVSRQIASLEKQLKTRLFERSPDGATLTIAGRRFRDAVTAGLGLIQEAAVDASIRPCGEQVVIACSEDTSQFYLLPRHRALQDALGEATVIRVLTYHHHMRQLPLYPVADVVLTWESSIEADEYVVLHQEIAGPVCSPQYAGRHEATLQQSVAHWRELTFLDLGRPNMGWASWEDWFRVVGCPEPAPRLKAFDRYSYVLDAAIHGQGIAMGWRHYIENHLETGTLVRVDGDFVEFDNRFCGTLTTRGRSKPMAQRCLTFLAEMT